MNFKIKLVGSFIYKGLNPTRLFLSSTSGKLKILKNELNERDNAERREINT